MRLQFGFPSRHKTTRPTDIPFNVHRGNQITRKLVSAKDSPTTPIIVPIFEFPRLTTRLPSTPVIVTTKAWVWRPARNQTEEQRLIGLREDEADAISVPIDASPEKLLQMLSKIGFSAAVALYGLDNVPHSLRPYILGKNEHFTDVAGMSPTIVSEPPEWRDWMIESEIFDAGDRQFLAIKIELFRRIKMPTFWVIVGEADPHLIRLVAGLEHPKASPL
jgi:hypothetical protein